jgi:hypothetical protein
LHPPATPIVRGPGSSLQVMTQQPRPSQSPPLPPPFPHQLMDQSLIPSSPPSRRR